MIRYFYSIGFLVIGMGLPLLAKSTGTDYPTPSASSKAGSSHIPSSSADRSAAVAQAKKQGLKKSEVTLTRDTSRAAVSSALAAKQESDSPVTRGSSTMTYVGDAAPVRTDANSSKEANTPFFQICPSGFPTRTDLAPAPAREAAAPGRLARVTAYWAAEGDYYTGRCISATGVRLHDGDCAVDPNIIPYGSVVKIAGVGTFLAVDTGSAVISRTAAREGGHTSEERNAIVVDVFFANRSEGEKFAAADAKYTSISWWTPTAMGSEAKAARSLFAEEDWGKIQSKQL